MLHGIGRYCCFTQVSESWPMGLLFLFIYLFLHFIQLNFFITYNKLKTDFFLKKKNKYMEV